MPRRQPGGANGGVEKSSTTSEPARAPTWPWVASTSSATNEACPAAFPSRHGVAPPSGASASASPAAFPSPPSGAAVRRHGVASPSGASASAVGSSDGIARDSWVGYIGRESKLLTSSFSTMGTGFEKVWGKVALLRATKMKGWESLSLLPGFFTGISCILDGMNDVLEGSASAFEAIHTYYPKAPRHHNVPFSSSLKPYAPHAACGPSSGLNSILYPSQILERGPADNALILSERGSRKSPKKAAAGVNMIRTMEELQKAIDIYRAGEMMQLVDISDDVSLDLALNMWIFLLSKGAIRILRRDSKLSQMAKHAYALKEQKKCIEHQILTLSEKLDELELSRTALAAELQKTNAQLAKQPGRDFSNSDAALLSSSSGNSYSCSISESAGLLSTGQVPAEFAMPKPDANMAEASEEADKMDTDGQNQDSEADGHTQDDKSTPIQEERITAA